MRGNARSTATESSYNNRVRRMVNLPRSILGSISRAMDQGINLLRIGSRRNYTQYHNPQLSIPFQNPPDSLNIPFQQLHLQPQTEEWAFLDSFEQQFGSTTHPFFYACSYMDALKIAKDEGKFIFLYLHSPEHPFTPLFCRETLCCELVVQFLDANFVCWAALANRGEGFQLASTLKASTFPFCALVAPAFDDSIAILQQLEGPLTPSELVEIMQNTLEEEGLAFGSGKSKREENRRADIRLREEQDSAYIASLHIDQEKEKEKLRTSTSVLPKRTLDSKYLCSSSQEKIKQSSKGKEAARAEGIGQNQPPVGKGNAQVTQILVRFPNGERKEHSFLSSDKIQAIFRYIDSLNLRPGIGNYRLVSNFPKKVYGVDQMGMSLKDAGLHTKASLFLELL